MAASRCLAQYGASAHVVQSDPFRMLFVRCGLPCSSLSYLDEVLGELSHEEIEDGAVERPLRSNFDQFRRTTRLSGCFWSLSYWMLCSSAHSIWALTSRKTGRQTPHDWKSDGRVEELCRWAFWIKAWSPKVGRSLRSCR